MALYVALWYCYATYSSITVDARSVALSPVETGILRRQPGRAGGAPPYLRVRLDHLQDDSALNAHFLLFIMYLSGVLFIACRYRWNKSPGSLSLTLRGYLGGYFSR
jgi:hypothetical protein